MNLSIMQMSTTPISSVITTNGGTLKSKIIITKKKNKKIAIFKIYHCNLKHVAYSPLSDRIEKYIKKHGQPKKEKRVEMRTAIVSADTIEDDYLLVYSLKLEQKDGPVKFEFSNYKRGIQI